MIHMDRVDDDALILESLKAIQITNKKPDEMELIGILFKTENDEIIDLICSILKKLMRTGNMIEIDITLIQPGLSSPNTNIILTVLEYLSTRSISGDRVTLQKVALLLDHKNQNVLELAMGILENAALGTDNVSNFFMWIQPIIQQYLDQDNIASFELVARWCQQSTAAFNACATAGMISFATEFSPSHDVLLSLTVIELFKDIAKSQAGFSFLVQTGVLEKLSSVLQDEHATELILVATVKFWGLVSFHQPEKLELLDSMRVFSRMTELESPVLKEAVVVAVGNIGSTLVGLLFLNDQSILLNYYLTKVFPYATNDLKVVCLKTLSCLLEHSEHPQVSAGILNSAFERQVPVEALISLSKNSIVEISTAAFSCLTNMCNFEWGCQAIADSQSFNYFLERKPELSNFVKEWKYSILKAIVKNPNSEAMFAPSVFKRIQDFIKDGPFAAVYNPQVSFVSS